MIQPNVNSVNGYIELIFNKAAQFVEKRFKSNSEKPWGSKLKF